MSAQDNKTENTTEQKHAVYSMSLQQSERKLI